MANLLFYLKMAISMREKWLIIKDKVEELIFIRIWVGI